MQLRAQVGTRETFTKPASPDFLPPIYGLDVEHHGGECCGIKHLHSFPYCGEEYKISEAEKRKWVGEAINRAIDKFGDFEDGGYGYDEWRGCIEVVLVESQIKDWGDTLEEHGFSQVYSFLNHNSGNECFVYLCETNRPK